VDYNKYMREISKILFDMAGKGIYWIFNDNIVSENWVYDQFNQENTTMSVALEIQKRFVEKYGPTDRKD